MRRKIHNIPQAFPYQGSKRKLAPAIIKFIPESAHRLVEPFAGSAAISVAAAFAGSVNEFWLNDAHAALMSLWHRIIHDPDGLALDYMTLWQSQIGRERDFYNQVRLDFNASQKPELLLFLLARCVKAAIRYNRRGEFNNSPDHRRKGMMPGTMQQTLRLVSEALGRGTRLTSTDYKQVLAKTTRSDFVFMDPPYQGVAKQRDNRYISGVDFDEFVCELESLNKREIPFAVSYDGRTGDKIHGQKLPDHLQLYHVEMLVGRSTQATLLGRSEDTFESVYISHHAQVAQRAGARPVKSRPTELLFA